MESGKPKAQVARELDISDCLLYNWVSKYDEAKSRGLTPDKYSQEKAEIHRLKAEVKRLQEENDILKNASADYGNNSSEVRLYIGAS